MATSEPLLSWKRSCFLLVGLLVVIFLLQAAPWVSSSPPGPDFQQTPSPQKGRLWQFGNASVDNEAIDGLTEAECATVFPHLYADIDRAVAYWTQKGHIIQHQDLEMKENQAGLWLLAHNNELRVLESRHASGGILGPGGRSIGTLHLIRQALDAAIAGGEKLPTVEFALNLRDDSMPESGTHSFWAAARDLSEEAYERVWLFPNFDMWYYGATGSFHDAKRLATGHDADFVAKVPKMVWRGNPDFNVGLRQLLINVTEGKAWADVKAVRWNEDPPVSMDVDQFCKYAMTVYTEGVTYSGRLKFLMNCKSLLFVHDLKWATYYSHLLESEGPNQNYVAVRRDWKDLEQKVKHYLDHPEEAETVISNLLTTFRSRYTTRAATSCYIRRLMRSYSSVAFTPEVYASNNDDSRQKLRGRSYEHFMQDPQDGVFERD